MFPVDESANQHPAIPPALAIGRRANIELLLLWEFRLMSITVTSSKHEEGWKHWYLQMRSTAMSVGAAWFFLWLGATVTADMAGVTF
jgi:hypothetical protein